MTYLLAPVASGAYTCGSLFTGIGGIDLAFVRNGFDVRWQVEIESFCQAVLNKHKQAYWPNAKLYEDVHHVGKANLEPVDIIFGGFPCQSVSLAGKREGIKEGTQSGLWLEFARIISELRPRLVLLENVRGILSKDGVRVIADLTRLGYDTEWGVLSAASIGAPHERKRWFCVAYANSQRFHRSATVKQSSLDQERKLSALESGGSTILHETIASSQDVGDAHCFGYKIGITDMGSEMGEWGNYPNNATTAENSSALAYPKSAGLAQSRPTGVATNETQAAAGMDNRSERCSDPAAVCQPSIKETESILGDSVNGLPRQLARLNRWPARPGEAQHEWEAPRTHTEKISNRNARLRALGNAVVPQVVEPIAAAIRAYLAATSGANGAGA